MTPRLNLGCGDFYAPGWVNVDLATDADRTVDVVASATALPVAPSSLSAAYCGHVLEHLPHDAVVPVLADLRRCLAPGAPVMVVGPDVDRGRYMHRFGLLDDEELDAIVHGGDRWPGDQHLWPCREAALVDALAGAGFAEARAVPIEDVGADWPVVSHIGWQCAAVAVNGG